ncbi:AEC family transporter [Anaerotruncus colihominis]|jgi:predicted permease|uniref:AEC family transporter n=1 Tax=Anaerotruncus colihominis TaxID=169435 RepID=A0A845SYJ5_9FIRM|nr:AEC family transporter [Anaerotruncus colihominis]MCR2026843.1 AEC family transporter [Anaerotruncus colihominis]NDO39584.1 hypothetical protein [Anaerotruncus colihominis]
MALKLAGQVAVMFILLGVGIVIRRRGIVSQVSAEQFSGFVLLIVTPTLLIQSFQRDFEPKLGLLIAAAALLTIVFHLLAIPITKLVFRGMQDDYDSVGRLSAICSNCGFMGIPLMSAAMGELGALVAAVYIAVFNLYIWSHGVMILRRTRQVSAREILLTPCVVAALAGTALFLLRIRLPGILQNAMGYLAGLNTPLPMIITGILIAEVKPKTLFNDFRLWITAAMRLLVLPLAMLAVLLVLRAPSWFDGAQTAALGVMIACACPTAVSCVMMPARFDADAALGARLVAVTTLLSIVTIPLITQLSAYLFRPF